MNTYIIGWIETIAVTLGLIVTVLGIVGGLLSLPDKWKAFRTSRRPLGDRGTTSLVLHRRDADNSSTITFLVDEDVFHFISAFGGDKLGAEVQFIEQIGDYYKVVITFLRGVADNLVKTKKRK